MYRLLLLLALMAAVLTGCGAPAASSPPPTAAPTGAPPTASPPPPTATPQAPTASPLPPTAAPTATPSPTPRPAGSVRYLLPPDFNAGYSVMAGSERGAGADGFRVSFAPLGMEPGPGVTLHLVGGPEAAPVWRENQPGGLGALILPVTVRGVAGTLASSGYGATVAWEEAGVPYYANLTGDDTDAMLAWVDALVAYERPAWEALVTAASPDRLPRMTHFVPAGFPAGYGAFRWSDDHPAEEGYALWLYPDGLAEDPTESASITLLGGDLAAAAVAQALGEPALLGGEDVTVRGQPGRLALAPGGLLLAWVEGETPYALLFDGVPEDLDAWLALAAGFEELSQSAWLTRVTAAR